MPSVSILSPVSRIRACTGFMLQIILVIWYQGISLDSSCNTALRAWRFFSDIIMNQTLCFKKSFPCSIVDMSDEGTGHSIRQHCSDERNFADSGEV